MCCTCWLIILQYFVIAEFILGFFLQNIVKLGCRPPDLVQKRVLGALYYRISIRKCSRWMCCTCCLIIYQYFAIADFILGFFLQNSVKPRYRPPYLVQKGVLGAPIIPHMATDVKWIYQFYRLIHQISVDFTCRIYFTFLLQKAIKLKILPPDLVQKRGLMTGNWINMRLFYSFITNTPY